MIIHGYLEGNVLILTVNYKLKEGKRDEFVKRLLREKIAEHTRMEQGCIKYEYYLPIDRADELFLLEAWESREDQQIHFQSDHMRKMREFKSEYVESTELGQM